MNIISSVRFTLSVLSILVIVILNTSRSYAEDAPCNSGIDCLVGGYGGDITVRKLLVKLPTDSEIVLDTQKIQNALNQSPQTEVIASLIDLALPTIYPTDAQDNPILPASSANYLYTFDPGAGALCPNPKINLPSCKLPATNSLKNANFNTFYGTLVYDDAQKTAATNFVKAATLQGLPIKQADISKMLQGDSPEGQGADFTTFYNTNETLKKYLAAIRQYTTIQTTAISNLMREYNERLPLSSGNQDQDKNSDLGRVVKALNEKNPNFPSDLKKVSRSYLENYLATRRVNDPNWYNDLASNYPAQLQRQMVILQAENLAETYRLRKAIDRLTATMSVAMMQSAYNAQIQIEALRAQLNVEAQKASSPK